MSNSIPWKSVNDPPEMYKHVLVLLKDNTVRYGYYTNGKGWWIYSYNNGYIVTLEAVGWKLLQ